MKARHALVSLAAIAAGHAQSLVVPIGAEHLSGTGNGRDTWNHDQVRFLVVLDRSQFPWGSRGFRLTGIKLRRSTQGIAYGLEPHTRTSSVILSVDGRAPGALSPTFTQNHGSPTTTVLSRVDVPFPCGTRLEVEGTYVAAPFGPTFSFPNSPFLVPAGASNLVIEFQVVADEKELDWPVDDEGSNRDRGAMRRMGEACPPTPLRCNSQVRQRRPLEEVGSELGFGVGGPMDLFVVLDSNATAGLLMLGNARSTAIVLPNGCSLWVDPLAFCPLLADKGRLTLGLALPNEPDWIGVVLGAQFAVIDGVNYALSPGVAFTIGSSLARPTAFASVVAGVPITQPFPETGGVGTRIPVLELVGTVQ